MIRIDKIKDKLKNIPILEVADKLGIDHKGKSAKCFMHDDKNPSLGFNPRKNNWKCYVCDKGGDQISLVMAKLELPYIDACKWLADQFNISIPEDDGYRKKVPIKPKRKLPAANTKETINSFVDVDIIAWIVNHALLSNMAKDFLFNKRKYKQEVVEKLRIGSITDSVKLSNILIETFGIDRVLKSGIVHRSVFS